MHQNLLKIAINIAQKQPKFTQKCRKHNDLEQFFRLKFDCGVRGGKAPARGKY